jgi:hypothetical protein
MEVWCARGTYKWIIENRAMVRAIDDISGEHGRNIGHTNHMHGTDIDMMRYITLPDANPLSGG